MNAIEEQQHEEICMDKWCGVAQPVGCSYRPSFQWLKKKHLFVGFNLIKILFVLAKLNAIVHEEN